MPRTGRSQYLLILGSILISAYFLVPTIFGFGKMREKAESQNKPLPRYVNFFPKETINLGLDLRGGISLEVEVEEKDALNNRADMIASELPRLTEKEPYAPTGADRIPDSSDIRVTLKDEGSRDALNAWIRENYHETLVEKKDQRDDKKAVFALSDAFAEKTKDMAVRQALETIRHRIDRYGVAEPSIVRVGSNRISIELPGMSDPDRALSLVKKSGRLEFRLVDEATPDEDVRRLVSEARTALNLPADSYTTESTVKLNAQLKGKIPEDSEILYEIEYDPTTKKTLRGIPYLLKRKAQVTGDMLKNTQVNVQDNEPYVSLNFDGLGTQLFGELTKENIGKRLAIVLDGQVSKAPVIKSEIPSGQAQITLGSGGDYQSMLKEAEDLTLVLHEGALPARVHELTKTVVGPSLGQDSIRSSLRVCLIAGALVMLFMLFYYKISGLLADVALTLNIFFIMAALAMFQATLTLPGIAGIVLTIGMAVDANVLIFERMREELKDGKSAAAALKEGYKNATTAILDSNITTFLAGAVLYQFGTGPIRGFAVTLMIGITTTLFTALIVTRVLQETILGGRKTKALSV